MIQVQQAVQVLRRGGVVCFPTETVYGLGARLFDEMAIRAVYQIKGRPRDNPLIVHISDLKMLELLVVGMPLETQNLVKKFWPGPLTIVCKKSEFVSRSVTAGLETVAIRMPRHPVATELLSALKEPIAAPSANRSGRPSPTRHEDVLHEMRGKADLILDGGQSDFGLESTVVDLAHRPFKILRPGCVTAEELKTVLPEIQINSHKSGSRKAISPGTKHRHYVPECQVVLVPPEEWETVLQGWRMKSKKLGVLSHLKRIPLWGEIIFKQKFSESYEEYARHLYASFFNAEKAGVQVLLVESVGRNGIGLAVMDRLTRASGIQIS